MGGYKYNIVPIIIEGTMYSPNSKIKHQSLKSVS